MELFFDERETEERLNDCIVQLWDVKIETWPMDACRQTHSDRREQHRRQYAATTLLPLCIEQFRRFNLEMKQWTVEFENTVKFVFFCLSSQQ